MQTELRLAHGDVILQVEEVALGNAEVSAEAQGGIDGDRALILENLLNARNGDLYILGKAIGGYTVRLHKFFGKNLADFRCGDMAHIVCLHSCMIVRDFDIGYGIFAIYAKTDAVLLIDANAVLSLSVTFELFRVIGRRNPQIVQTGSIVQHDEFSQSDLLNALREFGGKVLAVYFFCFFAGEILYNIPDLHIHVKQSQCFPYSFGYGIIMLSLVTSRFPFLVICHIL